MSNITFNFETGCTTCHKPLIVHPEFGGCGCNRIAVPQVSYEPNSPCVECDTPCDDITSSECWTYGGADIPQLGIKNGDNGTKIIVMLASELLAAKSRLAILEA